MPQLQCVTCDGWLPPAAFRFPRASRCDCRPNRAPFNPAARPLLPRYHRGEINHCPGCGRTNWLIGRSLAECAFCSTALPLDGQ